MKTDEPFHIDVVSVKLSKDFKLFTDDKLTTPEGVAKLATKLLKDKDRENIVVFNLMTDGSVANAHIAGVGTINSCVAHPRELLKAAILSNAASIIMAHNHITGSLKPSDEDIMLTHRMAKVCNLMQIYLQDHVIVAGGESGRYMSMLEEGILERKGDTLDVRDSYLEKVAERSAIDDYFHERRDSYGKVR